MRILHWHVHGSWTTAFVQGGHDYLIPVTPGRDADGLGRARTWDWPASAVEVPAASLRDADIDVVVLQRPEELALTADWTGREPGSELPAVFVEHNTPAGEVPCTRHPLADRADIPVVHVTHFNRLFWDCGSAPTRVVEHGVIDPGHRFDGSLARAAVVVNDPVRRGRTVGADLLAPLAAAVPVDVFGMRVDRLPATPGLVTHEDLPQARMHEELARRRVYVHTPRWTSLGLSLIEAMMLGLPVVGLAVTEAVTAVPPEAGVLTTRPDELCAAARRFVADPDLGRAAGTAGRAWALERFGIGRFLADWDAVLGDVTA
jgi:glycosyltransferase involved in cell wall biosynthesis